MSVHRRTPVSFVRRALVTLVGGSLVATVAILSPQGAAPAAAATDYPAPILTGPGAPKTLVTTAGTTPRHRSSFTAPVKPLTPKAKPGFMTGDAQVAVGSGAARVGSGVVSITRPGQTPSRFTAGVPTASTALVKSSNAALGSSPASRVGDANVRLARAASGDLVVQVKPNAVVSSPPIAGSAASKPSVLTIDAGTLPTSGDGLARLRATSAGKPVPVTVARDGSGIAIPLSLATASTTTLSAGASGPSGDYSATELAPASSWGVSEQTGAFTWSYPVTAPGSSGGLDPDLAIGYSSGSVDGRVASTNNQPSWVGEGFSLDPGHVDRAFASCREDMTGGSNASRKTGDLCWKNDNASIVLGGSATRIVKDTATGIWRLQDDDGSRVEHLTGATNGDNDGEYWKVTTTDGTSYFFGKNTNAAGTVTTDSTWTVPVNGNQAGEPCYNSTFAQGFCDQAWRWNLDYVTDAHGNSITYSYAKETNRYGQNLDTKSVSYVRGGYLKTIDYGQRAGTETATNQNAQVAFDVAERCVPSGSVTCADPAQLTEATQTSWPDVPFDLICTSTTSCETKRSAPSFFSRKKLTIITTKVRSGGVLTDVAKVALGQSFPDPGDGTSAGLFLDSVTATGLAGGTGTVPPIQFGRTQMTNRVDTDTDGSLPMVKWRVNSISTETGATITVVYNGIDCATGTSMPASADANNRRCFPVYWNPNGEVTPSIGWFHTYPVASISEDAGVSTSQVKLTRYTYSGGPAWHYDSNPIAAANRRTWSENRGYATVTTTAGAVGEPNPLVSKSTYLRGMDGDKLAAGGATSVTVTASDGTVVTDRNQFAGQVLEDITYNGAKEVGGTVSTPWTSAARATDSLGVAYLTDTSKTSTRTIIAGSATPRTVQTRTEFNTDGDPVLVRDDGDTTTSADDRCTRLTYTAANTALNLRGLIATSKTVAVSCDTTANPATDTITDTRTYYDNLALGAVPTKGDSTKTEALSVAPSTYQTMSTATYDTLGRTSATSDPLGRTTQTAYTPADESPTTQIVTTNPLGHTATAIVTPVLGQPTLVTDANGVKTTINYDPLGRTTKVWQASRATTALPNLEYSYSVSKTAPSAVTTKTLLPNSTRPVGSPDQVTATALVDGLLRPLQSQASVAYNAVDINQGVKIGRSITDTIYDSRGLAIANRGPWPDTATAPKSTYVAKQDNELPALTRVAYDGAGRPVTSTVIGFNTTKSVTTQAYNGDSTDVLPPAGGTATRTIIDARGHTTELRQYKAATITGTPAVTSYIPNNKDQLVGMRDPDGSTWAWTYDLLGRKTTSVDPDSGTSTSTYDAAGQVTTSTDGTGKTLSYSYDLLGRKTALKDGTTTRASWAYDTAPGGKGQLATATRYESTGAYVTGAGSYNAYGQPNTTTVTIPAGETGLGGAAGTTYKHTNHWYTNGQLAATELPTAPGLATEGQSYGYDGTGRPMQLVGNSMILSAVQRDEYGALTHYQQSSSTGYGIIVNQAFESGTHRLQTLRMDRPNVTTPEVATTFSYNPAGQITSAADVPDPKNAARTDRQCYQYDALNRLTEAWSNGATTCSATPAFAASGAAPYWTSWTMTDGGKRLSERAHASSSTNDTLTTYTYPAATVTPTAQNPTPAHAPSKVTRKVGAAAAVDYPLTYDAAGRTKLTPLDWFNSTITSDAEGRTLTVGRAGKTSPRNIYDADGNLLIKGEVNGSKTLMLGTTRITYTPAVGTTPASTKSMRLFSFEGQIVAVRTANNTTGLYFTPPGQQGTTPIQVNAANQAVTKRYYTPYGDDRTTVTGWQINAGFLAATGATTDTLANLTHLGARDYDPNLGRFLSVDPLLNPGDPSQGAGYGYSGNDPINMSDASGLMGIYDEYGSKDRFSNGQVSGRPNKPHSPSAPKKGRSSSIGSSSSAAERSAAPFWLNADRRRHDVAADLAAVTRSVQSGGKFPYQRGSNCGSQSVCRERYVPGGGPRVGSKGFVDIALITGRAWSLFEVKKLSRAPSTENARNAERQMARYATALSGQGIYAVPSSGPINGGMPMVTTDPENMKNDLIVTDMTGKPRFPNGYISWEVRPRSNDDASQGSGNSTQSFSEVLRDAHQGAVDALLPAWAQTVVGVGPIAPGANVPMPVRVPVPVP